MIRVRQSLLVIGVVLVGLPSVGMAAVATEDAALQEALRWHPRAAISAEQQLKLDAIERVAMSYGAQVGQQAEARRLNDRIKRQAVTLDGVYNFNSVMLPDDLLPPVLDMTDRASEIEQGGNATVSVAKSFRVIADATFVRAAPTWRDYLIQPEISVIEPDPLLSPGDALERSSFEAAVKKGYEAGRQAAQEVWRASLARLQRDYLGMLLYKRLWIAKMVESPRTMTEKADVRGDDRGMDVGIVRRVISQPVVLVRDADKWRTFATEMNSIVAGVKIE